MATRALQYQQFQDYENALRRAAMREEVPKSARGQEHALFRQAKRDAIERQRRQNEMDVLAGIVAARGQAAEKIGGTLGNVVGSTWAGFNTMAEDKDMKLEDMLRGFGDGTVDWFSG